MSEKPRGTLVLLRGHHSTYVKGQRPRDLEHALREYKAQESQHPVSEGFFYIQAEDYGDNDIALDPEAIVGFVAVT